MGRKEKKAGLPTMGLVSAGLVCLFIAGAGCSFLWNKNQIHSLGQQIRYYEGRLDEAKQRHLMLDQIYAKMCSRGDLEERVKRMKLDLAAPSPDQIVRLPENVSVARDEKMLVARRASANEEGRN
jgi:hypothetical protein